jgi:hypothetical protein
LQNKLAPFQNTAESFTVLSLAREIPFLCAADDTLDWVVEQFAKEEPASPHALCLVDRGDGLLGWIERWGIGDPGMRLVDEVCRPLPTTSLIPDSTTLLDAIPRLSKSPDPLFVITTAGVTHYLKFEHLEGLAFRVSLFSLFAALEESALDLIEECGVFPRDLFVLLDEQLQKRAKATYKRKFSRMPEDDFVDDPDVRTFEEAMVYARLLNDCLYFGDIVQILTRDDILKLSLPFQDPEEAVKFFDRVTTVRNGLAHSSPILVDFDGPADLHSFISRMQAVTASIADDATL